MSLESFIPSESGEGISAASLEALREKMKAAAAQIAALKKEEGKQKQKEDELLKILLKFIQSSHKKTLITLVSRVLSYDIPANFVLSLILLGNREIQQEVGKFLSLPAADQSQALVFFQEDQSLPLKIKIELDQWVKNILAQAQETPQKLLKTSYEYLKREDGETDEIVNRASIELFAHVLNAFLRQNQINEPIEKLLKFGKFILGGILSKTQETLDDRKMIN